MSPADQAAFIRGKLGSRFIPGTVCKPKCISRMTCQKLLVMGLSFSQDVFHFLSYGSYM